MAVGLLAVGLGMGGVALVLDSDQYLFFAVPLILIGAGDGVALTIASDTVLAVAPKDRAGAASAVSETGYELGTALGIALLGKHPHRGLPRDIARARGSARTGGCGGQRVTGRGIRGDGRLARSTDDGPD